MPVPLQAFVAVIMKLKARAGIIFRNCDFDFKVFELYTPAALHCGVSAGWGKEAGRSSQPADS